MYSGRRAEARENSLANAGNEREEKRRVRLWAIAGFWTSIAISVAAVLRRLVALAWPQQTGRTPSSNLDAVFASHTALTLGHIVPALLFVLLAGLVYLPGAHYRWAERLLYPLGLVVGTTAYLMSAHPVGGWIERAAVLLFNSFFLFSMFRSFLYAQAGRRFEQRRWLTRAVGILLGIATTRPVMAIFFATSGITHLNPAQFFGPAFWLGFSINTIAVEIWLSSTRRTGGP